MDVMMSLDSVQRIKFNAIKAMNLKAGDNILEIGCGHGEDAELIGSMVGDNGYVVATDLSKRMIEEAQRRSKQQNVKYMVADLNDLQPQYPYKSFSGCHADRLLVSAANYSELFRDTLKYIKPGGVVSFTDVDAISIILQPYNKITKLVLSQIHECFVNPSMGSKLPDLFAECGLEDIRVIPEHSMVKSFDTMSKIFQFENIIADAVKSKKFSKEEGEQWLKDMQIADKQGKFLYCITMFTVVGHMPKNSTLF
jgi:ubiquinone/menaquinone biosynthesis C-methylase UbiE